MVRIAICDDQKNERDVLRRFITEFFSDASYECAITEYEYGENLCADYEEGVQCYDLIFLNIYLSGIDGMKTARVIRSYDKYVPIVFLAATPDYALEGYEVRAFGYLVKPFVIEKAAELLDFFLKTEFCGAQKLFLLREGARGTRIRCSDICFVESYNNRLIIHMEDGKQHRIYDKLDHLQQELPEHSFLRCHQSYIVNMTYIKAAEDDFILDNDVRVPIRCRNAKKFRDAYYRFLMNRAVATRL